MTPSPNRYLDALNAKRTRAESFAAAPRGQRAEIAARPTHAALAPDAFGAVLRAIRGRAGISQSNLAEWADCDHSLICRYENGTRTPTREMTERIAKALDLRNDDRDRLRHAGGFRTDNAKPLLSCPALAALDDAHRNGTAERRAWIERWIALALEAS